MRPTAGALMGGGFGPVSALGPAVLGPAVWVKTLGCATPVFPYDPPAILTMPLAFAVAWAVSVARRPKPVLGALFTAGLGAGV